MLVRRTAIHVSTVLIALTSIAPPSFAGTVSGRNVALASVDDVVLTGIPQVIATATIQRAKKNRVLIVHAMLTDYEFTGNPQRYGFAPRVSGHLMEPTADGAVNPPQLVYFEVGDQAGATAGTTTGTWWLDLDEAGLVGEPLVIELLAAADFSVDSTVTASFTAVMQQK